MSRLFGSPPDRNRRVVCYYPREHGSTSVGTLADLVAGWAEAGPGPDEAVDYDDVRVGLHHVHLPVLDAAGLVEYDAAAGTVTFGELSPALDRFDADLRRESLPIPGESGYLVVRSGGEYLGAVPAAALDELRDPSGGAPWDATVGASAYRDLVALLSGADFELTGRRRLVATAREVEDRAWRTGRGSLYATFQSLSAFRSQAAMYDHLAGTTDLDVAVFGEADWAPPGIDGVAVHRDEAGEITEFWVVAFDGAGEDDARCAMLAEEGPPGTYTVVVTYDPEVVDEVTAHRDGVAASTP